MTIRHGYAFKSRHFVPPAPGLPLIVKPGNFIPTGGLDLTDGRADAFAADWPRDFELKAGDLLVVMTCQTQGGEILGVPGVVPDDGRVYLHNQRLGKVTLSDRLHADYAYWLLSSWPVRDQLIRTATGSTVLHTSPGRIEAVEVTLPPLSDQARIAAILRAIAEKIDSNRRLAALLEETAATLFRARFVDFVGVTEFVDSEIGPIPSGWNCGALGDLVGVKMGQSPPGSSYTEDSDAGELLVQGAGGFGDRYPSSQVFTSSPTKVVDAGTVLMTVRAPVGSVNIARTRVCLGRGVAGISSDHPAFCEFLVRSLHPRWASHESGTIFPAVNRAQITGLKVAIPPGDAREQFEDVSKPIVEQLAALHEESATLAEIRDALLPKLISGAIRVPDTGDPDEVIGQAVEVHGV